VHAKRITVGIQLEDPHRVLVARIAVERVHERAGFVSYHWKHRFEGSDTFVTLSRLKHHLYEQ
jgi:hypothetical protein